MHTHTHIYTHLKWKLFDHKIIRTFHDINISQDNEHYKYIVTYEIFYLPKIGHYLSQNIYLYFYNNNNEKSI